ncbi:MAG: hypothetical protein P4M11_13590 [Candidatus Pacebacteria bacterium]|nr:hypothetical protein [Candidatus Paceibacterota bacterium]
MCEKLTTCDGAYAALNRKSASPFCSSLTTLDDSDVDLAFYEGTQYTDFNTTTIEMSYKTNTSETAFTGNKNVTFRARLVCDSNFADEPKITVTINDTALPKYTVLFQHKKCIH